jgi:hypothetical protein
VQEAVAVEDMPQLPQAKAKLAEVMEEQIT